jgi:hypothetical protein
MTLEDLPCLPPWIILRASRRAPFRFTPFCAGTRSAANHECLLGQRGFGLSLPDMDGPFLAGLPPRWFGSGSRFGVSQTTLPGS